MKVKGGCYRSVLLIGCFAIKIPRLNYGWSLFLKGLLSNMQEAHFNRMNDGRLCPIIFKLPGGFLIVMGRCTPLTDMEFNEININRFWLDGDYKVPVENKLDSFGWYRGEIVALDYGN